MKNTIPADACMRSIKVPCISYTYVVYSKTQTQVPICCKMLELILLAICWLSLAICDRLTLLLKGQIQKFPVGEHKHMEGGQVACVYPITCSHAPLFWLQALPRASYA